MLTLSNAISVAIDAIVRVVMSVGLSIVVSMVRVGASALITVGVPVAISEVVCVAADPSVNTIG